MLTIYEQYNFHLFNIGLHMTVHSDDT